VGVGVALVNTLSILLHVLLVLLRVSGEADAIALHKAPVSAMGKNHQLVRLGHMLCLVLEALACCNGVSWKPWHATNHHTPFLLLMAEARQSAKKTSMHVALYTGVTPPSQPHTRDRQDLPYVFGLHGEAQERRVAVTCRCPPTQPPSCL